MAEILTPGVYIEELPPGAQPIEGVDTAVTAFIGRTRRGPVDMPVPVASYSEFERRFGGLSAQCPLTYAVQQFFANGGLQAVIVRVRNGSRAVTDGQISDAALQPLQRGLWALDKIEAFNLLCIPPLTFTTDVGKATWDAAARYCDERRATLLVDAPRHWNTIGAGATPGAVLPVTGYSTAAALYFPRLLASDALSGKTREFAPGGAVAGVMARTDAELGVWKSPAGRHAVIRGASGLSVAVTTAAQEALSAEGINCLREFPALGVVVFGARTLVRPAEAGGDFKYVPVRRLFLFVERSLYRGLQWTVFEGNDEPLWARVRAVTSDFLVRLWRDGALMGAKPDEAFFVRCGRNTMTQPDIDAGRLIVEIGLAPLRPAEFVILRVTLKTGG